MVFIVSNSMRTYIYTQWKGTICEQKWTTCCKFFGKLWTVEGFKKGPKKVRWIQETYLRNFFSLLPMQFFLSYSLLQKLRYLLAASFRWIVEVFFLEKKRAKNNLPDVMTHLRVSNSIPECNLFGFLFDPHAQTRSKCPWWLIWEKRNECIVNTCTMCSNFYARWITTTSSSTLQPLSRRRSCDYLSLPVLLNMSSDAKCPPWFFKILVYDIEYL